jgi:hypothetical protein
MAQLYYLAERQVNRLRCGVRIDQVLNLLKAYI